MTQIPEAFSEMIGWLKPLCRFNKLENFIICDHNCEQNGLTRLGLKFFTKDNEYVISTKLPISEKGIITKNGYLGCIVKTRKPRAGENWNRGRDLMDGDYSKETFNSIIYDILAYELVKVTKKIVTKSK